MVSECNDIDWVCVGNIYMNWRINSYWTKYENLMRMLNVKAIPIAAIIKNKDDSTYLIFPHVVANEYAVYYEFLV